MIKEPSLQELIELANNAKKEKEKSELSKEEEISDIKVPSVQKFINQMHIKPGIELIPNYMIFYYYRVKWEGMQPPHKTNKIVFFREFNKMFKQKRTGKQRYYLLDSDTFDTSRKGMEEANYYEKTYQNKKVKKK